METGSKVGAGGDNTRPLKMQININDFDDGVVWDHTNLGRRRDGLGGVSTPSAGKPLKDLMWRVVKDLFAALPSG